jgi:hypothetical protein
MFTGTIINECQEIQPSTGACGETASYFFLGPEKHSKNSVSLYFFRVMSHFPLDSNIKL